MQLFLSTPLANSYHLLAFRFSSFSAPSKMHISKLRNADDTTLMAENEEEIKSHLMKGKEESEKAVLKLSMKKKKKKMMTSSPITLWHICG